MPANDSGRPQFSRPCNHGYVGGCPICNYDDFFAAASGIVDLSPAPPASEETPDELAWVIVRGGPAALSYFTGDEAHWHTAWSFDHLRAARYKTRYDANDQWHRGMACGSGAFVGSRVEEHMWVSTPRTPSLDTLAAKAISEHHRGETIPLCEPAGDLLRQILTIESGQTFDASTDWQAEYGRLLDSLKSLAALPPKSLP